MTCAVAAQKLQGGSKAAGRKLAKCSGTAKPKKARAWKTADHRVQVGLVRASSDRAASLKRLGFKGKATGRFFSLKASSGREAADLVVKALKVIGA
ncbi:MAG: hypothetical protein JNK72_24860 [Myxococcales bacterium]|nr:hypothetical protein [Myxococcales bacterium]